MRRVHKFCDEGLKAHESDGHLKYSRYFRVHCDEGNINSRSSTPSSSGSTLKGHRPLKHGRCPLDQNPYPGRKRRKVKLTTQNEELDGHVTSRMDISDYDDTADRTSDSFSFGESAEEDEGTHDFDGCSNRRHSIVPEFFENCDLFPLNLPKSSTDVFVENEFVMSLVGLYEILKHFHRHLRLGHFRFEDFCTALKNCNQSPLLSEIHICLIKALLRADDTNSVVYGPMDVKDSVNIFFYTLDYMTWYNIVKCYIKCGCSPDEEDAINVSSKSSFVCKSFEERLYLLQRLTDEFLRTNAVREELSRESSFQHEDQCRLCHKLGDLLCCETCPAVYHLECVGLSEVPQGDWICAACQQSEVIGVTDCMTAAERNGAIGRLEPIGFDRHLRKYWFLSRRIFVESETEVSYYSTKEQFESLLKCLDGEHYEKHLYEAMTELQDEVLRQMEITARLTKEFQKAERSVFDVSHDSSICCKSEFSDTIQSEVAQNLDVGGIMEVKEEDKRLVDHVAEMEDNCHKVAVRSKVVPPIPKLSTDFFPSVPPKSSKSSSFENLTNSSVGKEGVLKPQMTLPVPTLSLNKDATGCCCFKLGLEGSCLSYENRYSVNLLSVSRHLHIEEKEKRRHLSYKFSIPLSGEFHWCGPTSGDQETLTNTFKNTLIHLESSFPSCFLHPNWSSMRSWWIEKVNECSRPPDLGRVLIDLQMCIMPVIFNHIWHEALGHVSLKKTCVADKEEAKRRESRRWRLEEDEIFYKSGWVKYSLGVKHQLWKVRGEEYRIFGNGGWVWVSASRAHKTLLPSKTGLRKIDPEKREICKSRHLRIKNGRSNCKLQSSDDVSVGCLDNSVECHTANRNIVVEGLDDLSLGADFNISESLLDERFYNRLKNPTTSKLDGLLEKRMNQIEREEELKGYFESLVISFLKSEMNSPGNACLASKNGVNANVVECFAKKSAQSSLPEKVIGYSSMHPNSAEDYNDPVPNYNSSDLALLPLATLQELLAKGKLQMSHKMVLIIQKKLLSLHRTDFKTSLGKDALDKKDAGSDRQKEPRDSSHPDLCVLSRKHKCLFALERRTTNTLARKEGKVEVPGFSYSCKITNVAWPYPAPRPLFKTAWQHRTQTASNLAALCSQLRIMWACLRWDELSAKPPASFVHTTATETHIRSTEILEKRDLVGMRSEYLLREIIVPFAAPDESKSHEKYTPQRSGLRERRKVSMTLLRDPTISEKWVSEDRAELWQIKHFIEKRLKEKSKMTDEDAQKVSVENKSQSWQSDASRVQMPQSDGEEKPSGDADVQNKSVAQKIVIYSKGDGQIEIHGLQEDQQILQLPNGDIHIATSLNSDDKNGQSLSFILGPKIPLSIQNTLEVEAAAEVKVPEDDVNKEHCTHNKTHSTSTIPSSAASVTPNLLLQVISQALAQTHNLEVRDKLLSMQKLVQQKMQLSISSDLSTENHNNSMQSANKAPRTVNPVINQEEKDEQNRTAICAQVMRHLLDSVERNERLESKNLKKQEVNKGKIRQIAGNRLEIEVQARKEALRRDILYKRTVLEKVLRAEIEDDISKRKGQNESSGSALTVEEKLSRGSQKSSTSLCSDSESSCSLPKKKKQKPENETLSPEELFCICETPYDNSKFYIGCDQCQNWFHGSCVGITKSEAEKLDTYLCPRCRHMTSRSNLDSAILRDSQWKEVEKVVSNLKMHKSAWPFLQPVDPNEAPNYYSIITEPMDLSTVESKTRERRYRVLPDFVNDVMKIFDNCRYYNARNTKFYKCAEILEIYFSDKLRSLRTRLKIS